MIDAHIHIDDARFDTDRAHLIAQAEQAGISHFITPAVTTAGFDKLTDLSQQFSSIMPAYGLHPYYIDQHQPNDLTIVDNTLSNQPSCALGECGLDFYLKNLDKDKQRYYFEAQIELAQKHQLPLILHARGAVDAVYLALKNANYFNATIHSYNGSIEQTRQLIDRGLKFSFGGAICHPKAHKLHKLIKYCPLDVVMLETDAPDQNLFPNFKDRNVPNHLLNIIQRYAELTDLPTEHVIEKTTITTRAFFHIQD